MNFFALLTSLLKREKALAEDTNTRHSPKTRVQIMLFLIFMNTSSLCFTIAPVGKKSGPYEVKASYSNKLGQNSR